MSSRRVTHALYRGGGERADRRRQQQRRPDPGSGPDGRRRADLRRTRPERAQSFDSTEDNENGDLGDEEELRSICQCQNDNLSSSDDEEEERPLQLQEDIFAHVVVTYVRKGPAHQDTVRAVILLVFVLVGQLVIGWALFRHCMLALGAYESDLLDAMHRRGGASEFAAADEVMERVCGEFHAEFEPISDGLGVAFHEYRRWLSISVPMSRIESLHYQLRADFQWVFAFVTIFWTWRCFSELRSAWSELQAFLLFDQVETPARGSAGDEEDSPSSPSAASKTVSRAVSLASAADGGGSAAESTDGDDGRHDDEEGETRDIRTISRQEQVFVVVILLMRLVVALVLFGDGYVLLCMTERMVELIMNAVALEFIFDVDDLIVRAMLAKKEHQVLAKLKFRGRRGMMQTISERVGSRACLCHFPAATWRCRNWTRILTVCLVIVLFVWPRSLKVRSLHSRATALCFTDGLTDGTRPLPRDAPEVVFPVEGFCRSFIKAYSGIEEPTCGAWRLRVGEPLTFGLCTNTGDLTSAPWSGLTHIDEAGRRVCGELWFGQGVPAGAPIPVLNRFKSKPKPQMFGCRREDLVISDRKIPWVFFSGHAAHVVTLSCRRPAFGPASRAWSSTPLTSSRFFSPGYFFQFDAHSPIERQVGACDGLPALRRCNDDPCFVVADLRGTSCEQYCKSQSLVCSEAFGSGSHGQSCRRLTNLTCAETAPSSETLVCRCQLPPTTRPCGRLRDARARCEGDPCRVLVSQEDYISGLRTNFTSCVDYCASAGLRCLEQYTVREHSCSRDLRYPALACHDPLPQAAEARGRRLGHGHGHGSGGTAGAASGQEWDEGEEEFGGEEPGGEGDGEQEPGLALERLFAGGEARRVCRCV